MLVYFHFIRFKWNHQVVLFAIATNRRSLLITHLEHILVRLNVEMCSVDLQYRNLEFFFSSSSSGTKSSPLPEILRNASKNKNSFPTYFFLSQFFFFLMENVFLIFQRPVLTMRKKGYHLSWTLSSYFRNVCDRICQKEINKYSIFLFVAMN